MECHLSHCAWTQFFQTLASSHSAFNVPNLDLELPSLIVLLEIDVDGEMGVDISHLVQVSLGDANDHVVDQRSDSAEGSDVFSDSMVQLDVDNTL